MAMTGEACFLIWAPEGSPWSAWAKPVLFAQDPDMPEILAGDAALPQLPLPEFWSAGAVVVDLPGEEAVSVALALAVRGFRPVPLFNGTAGPNPVVAVEPLRRALVQGADVLSRTAIASSAGPAFLLDSRRMSGLANEPGRYDNRWIVLPQDCPSGVLLRSKGVTSVAVVQRGGVIADDLTHVLRRWQEAGIQIALFDIGADPQPRPITVARPSWFRWMWYSALAIAGLRRSYVGGFGSQIPERSGRSGFYG